MWLRSVYVASIIVLFVLASADGSCLEYGHSCWGAHGKRSGGALFGGVADLGTVERSSNQNRVAAAPDRGLAENLPDAERDRNGRVAPIKQYHATKLRSLLRKRHSDRMARQNFAGAELPAYQKKWLRNYVQQQQQQRKQPAEASELFQQRGDRESMRKGTNNYYFDYK